MIEDKNAAAGFQARPEDVELLAANDSGNAEAWPRIEAVVVRIARLIGRQMAREEFARLRAANDNVPMERRDD